MPKTDARTSPIHGFLATLSLLSRLPVPILPDAAFSAPSRHVWAYPLVGALLGLLGAIAGAIAFWLGLGATISAGIVVAAMLLSTGAMHEDGLADTFDGFWGATSRERRLEIMKDSQIGSYGVLSLMVVVGLRWTTIAALMPLSLWPLIAAAALSRGVLPLMMAATRNARATGLSHQVGRPALAAGSAALGLGILLALLCTGSAAILALIVAAAVVLAMRALALARIDGQTGDVLGATQQLCEVAMLITFFALY